MELGSVPRLLTGYIGRFVRLFQELSIMFNNWKKILEKNKTKFYDTKIKVSLIKN